MVIDDELRNLETELRRTGAVVVPHANHLCVRLPLLASVIVKRRDSDIVCEPQLGPFRRTSVLAGTAVATAAGVGALAAGGDFALALTAGAGGGMLMMLELAGLVLVESCVTRVQLLWATRLRDAEPRLALPRAATTQAYLERPAADDPRSSGGRAAR